jgi:hypothetical protein
MIEALISDEVLEAAYQWLCKCRRDHPPNTEIWWFRYQWPREKEGLRTDVKDYYASIDHFLLWDHLAVHIKDRKVMKLLTQYLRRWWNVVGYFKTSTSVFPGAVR